MATGSIRAYRAKRARMTADERLRDDQTVAKYLDHLSSHHEFIDVQFFMRIVTAREVDLCWPQAAVIESAPWPASAVMIGDKQELLYDARQVAAWNARMRAGAEFLRKCRWTAEAVKAGGESNDA